MRRYYDYAIFFDIILSIVISLCVLWGKTFLGKFLNMPSLDSLDKFGVTLITVSATLIGFLLTIITVIVTFKKGFEQEQKSNNNQKVNPTEFPKQTVFDNKESNEKKFYGTDLHKKVIDVFIYASFEIGLVLFVLLTMQFINGNLSQMNVLLISLSVLILVILSIIRSLYIFKLFLNVHLKKSN